VPVADRKAIAAIHEVARQKKSLVHSEPQEAQPELFLAKTDIVTKVVALGNIKDEEEKEMAKDAQPMTVSPSAQAPEQATRLPLPASKPRDLEPPKESNPLKSSQTTTTKPINTRGGIISYSKLKFPAQGMEVRVAKSRATQSGQTQDTYSSNRPDTDNQSEVSREGRYADHRTPKNRSDRGKSYYGRGADKNRSQFSAAKNTERTRPHNSPQTRPFPSVSSREHRAPGISTQPNSENVRKRVLPPTGSPKIPERLPANSRWADEED
jgi:hypothetical protein